MGDSVLSVYISTSMEILPRICLFPAGKVSEIKALPQLTTTFRCFSAVKTAENP
jgi:hypothetical protein